MKKIKRCKKNTHFVFCGSPLCVERSLSENDIWYCEEEICRSKNKNSKVPDWIKIQRKIKKVWENKGRPELGFFTKGMLEVGCVIGNGIKGINGDRDDAEQIRTWFRNHKPRKKLSPEEKKVLADRLSKSLGR